MQRRFLVSISIALASAIPSFITSKVSFADQLLGPSPYQSFADSPFNGVTFGQFFLEDFESGAVSVPGINVIGDQLRFVPSGDILTDSVDGDDGVIDELGRNGRDLWGVGTPGITVEFDVGILGFLPTHAGIVWTDGINPITFEAFDSQGVSLGTLEGSHADDRHDSGTVEDRFYGVIHASGISRIHIMNGIPAGIEVDHLQFGVPEPSSLAVLVGVGSLALIRRRVA